jgi:integrase
LRREEVAVLAGVSVPYYTRIERGDMHGVSDSVLEALARALQLDEAERAYLFDLARALRPTGSPRPRRALRQSIALAALDQLPPNPDCPLVFPSVRGGHLDLHNFRNRNWKPAQKAAGIVPLRRVYDLRHTFATFALRAGISTFDLSRYMGTSLAMIDRHYGHLARHGREHAIKLLDGHGTPEALDVHAVDAQWTLNDISDATADNGKGG